MNPTSPEWDGRQRRPARSNLRLTLSDAESAMLRSQGGPLASSPFISFPTYRTSRLEPQLLRVLFLRRMRLPLPLSARACQCGRPLDVLGHHRSACAVVGTLELRGFPLENAAARICREAGGRVRTNVLVRDLDLGPVRCTKARGRGGRTSPLPRSAVGSGHDTCLPLDSGRISQASPPRGCQTTEGGALPRTGCNGGRGSLGCARRRGRRPLLRRNRSVPSRFSIR